VLTKLALRLQPASIITKNKGNIANRMNIIEVNAFKSGHEKHKRFLPPPPVFASGRRKQILRARAFWLCRRNGASPSSSP
jgi:hypothetical protein